MRLQSRFNPVGGIQDFWSEFTRPTPYRWPILAVSLLCTFGLLFWVIKERVVGPPARPDVTYISTFAEGRTDDEIAASNRTNQALKEKLMAERAASEEEVRDMYRTLGRASGMDVDSMEADIAAERAREQAEQARLREAAGLPAGRAAEQTVGQTGDAEAD